MCVRGTDIYSCGIGVTSRGCYLLLVNVVRYTTYGQTMIRECLAVRNVSRRCSLRDAGSSRVSSRLLSRFFAPCPWQSCPSSVSLFLRPRNTTTYLTIIANKRFTVRLRTSLSIDWHFFFFSSFRCLDHLVWFWFYRLYGLFLLLAQR